MTDLACVKVTMRVEVVGQYNQNGPMVLEMTKSIGEGGNPLFVADQFLRASADLRVDIMNLLDPTFWE